MMSWYVNRLKAMSFSELFFRTGEFVRKKREQYFSDTKLPNPGKFTVEKTILEPGSFSANLFPEMISVFGKDFDYSSGKIDWHTDIFSGKSFPLSFSKSINIRNNADLSAKNVWEINRLQFLPLIAINYKTTRSEHYIDLFCNILSSWIDENPYLRGVNWYSNIEINLRLISWFFCWQILDVEKLSTENRQFAEFVEKRWIPSVYQHCKYSFNNPSRFSSANNHLVSEYAGLFIASSLWKFRESEKWLRYSAKGLEEEIKRQHSSGVNKEEAAEYIQFITDFFLIAYVVGEKTGRKFSGQYADELHAILKYISDFLDCTGNFPKYGDEDDGKCTLLGNDHTFNNFKSLLTSGAILYKDPVLKLKGNGFDLKNRILFGVDGEQVYTSVGEISLQQNSAFYRNEGHFIFKKQSDGNEIYLHFDAAPLGYLSIAAHGHADALSFILNVNGQPLFIDSGTYTYHTEPLWRSYFIGTLAHNTVRINKKNQAVNAGPTLWLDHFETVVQDSGLNETSEFVRASHNGYRKEMAQHTREVLFDKVNDTFIITDSILVNDSNVTEIEIPFHLHPDIKIDRTDRNNFRLFTSTGKEAELVTDEKLNAELISGQVTPGLLGWYSESFMNKCATNVIYCQSQIKTSTDYKFIIKIK
jgi:hypothetical protein